MDTIKIKPCKFCGATNHYPYQCRLNPKKPKRITRYGKKAQAYAEWRDTIAIPYLIATYGKKCALCSSTKQLDVDHVEKRRMGGAPSRTMNLNNVRFLCRTCHRKVT
jgi:5-methylcytosine-specific restriction endonuclease McrA